MLKSKLWLELKDCLLLLTSSKYCSPLISVMSNLKYNTKCSLEPLPYGAFEDYVILRSCSGASFKMHEAEFDWIARQLYDLYQTREEVAYIQILKEWNELVGFCSVEEKPSQILDLSDTVEAISQITASAEDVWGEPTGTDLIALCRFLNRNMSCDITIEKE